MKLIRNDDLLGYILNFNNKTWPRSDENKNVFNSAKNLYN